MKRFKKLLIATRNPAKVAYYKDILSEIATEIIGLGDLSIEGKPLESGSTAEQNAEIKAKFYSEKSGLPVFSEDEALYVDFLPVSEQPGTHVRRINGVDEVNDDQLMKYWEEKIASVPETNRTGKWHIVYCLHTTDGKFKTAYTDHFIKFFSPTSKIIIAGWPLSSLQGSIKYNKPHSEQTAEEREESKKEVAKELRRCLKKLV